MSAWLIDYYALAGGELLLVAIVLLFVRQPARRVWICRAAVCGLFVLLAVTLTPAWPRVSLRTTDDLPSETWQLASDDFPAATADSRADVDVSASATEAPAIEAFSLEEAGLLAPKQHNRSEFNGRPEPTKRWIIARFDTLLSAMFLFGGGCVVCWLVGGSLMAWRLRWLARPAPAPVQDLAARLVGGHSRSSIVLISDGVGQACAIGCWSPRIILPSRFLGQETCEALDAVLAHESTHVRNGDLRTLACVRLLTLVLFAHPLFWWLRNQLRIDQELLADAAAGQSGDAAEYAEILLNWFRANRVDRSRVLTASLGLWERPHLLKRRIAMLLNDQFRVESAAPRGWRVVSGAGVLALAAALSLVTLRPETRALADDAKPAEQPAELAAEQAAESTANASAQSDPEAAATQPTPEPAAANPSVTAKSEPAEETPESPPAETPSKSPVNDTNYKDAEEALRIGFARYSSRKYDEAREPLEAALKLADNDAFRLRIYQALKASYRRIPDSEPMLRALDFTLRHATTEAKRSITRTELIAFAYQRGLADVVVERYEAALAENGEDQIALFVLADAYERLKDDPAKASEMTRRLLALQDKPGEPVNVATSAQLARQLV
ncbi:MAG: M48 family metalloprotease, partial [Planctomycetales bacterium]|nr:M48 family metalloprotease [Planctomycetales bacterium]